MLQVPVEKEADKETRAYSGNENPVVHLTSPDTLGIPYHESRRGGIHVLTLYVKNGAFYTFPREGNGCRPLLR
jgi:hypothetical protein